MEFAINYWPC